MSCCGCVLCDCAAMCCVLLLTQTSLSSRQRTSTPPRCPKGLKAKLAAAVSEIEETEAFVYEKTEELAEIDLSFEPDRAGEKEAMEEEVAQAGYRITNLERERDSIQGKMLKMVNPSKDALRAVEGRALDRTLEISRQHARKEAEAADDRDRVETELCEALDAAEDAVRQAEEGTLTG